MPIETAAPAQAAAVQALTARPTPSPQRSLVVKLAHRFNVDADKLLTTLKATAFRQRPDRNGAIREPTNEEMMALLVIADQYGLNPFTKELFAFLDPKSGAIVPVISVDGWVRIINDRPELRSIAFTYSPETVTHKGKTCHVWMDCEIVRSDRDRPMVVREYFEEVVRKVDFATPWDSHPNRLHRHKTLIQCARIAFGFGGVYDEDEAGRILDGEASRVADAAPAALAQFNAQIPQPGTAPALPHAPAETLPSPKPGASQAPVAARGGEPQRPPTLEPPRNAKARLQAPVFTFAEVADKIAKATTGDALGEAVSLIDAVDDETQRAELLALAEQRETQIEGA